MVQKSAENHTELREWSLPMLEQLTVDLDAIATGSGACHDNANNKAHHFCS